MDSLRIKSKISRLTAARREGTAAVARVAWRWGERTLTALAAAGHGLTPPEMAAARALARWYAAQDARVDAERRARVEERARARGYASADAYLAALAAEDADDDEWLAAQDASEQE